MAKARKDNKGRALRKGESQERIILMYIHTQIRSRKKICICQGFADTKRKEADLIKNQLDGLDVYVAGNATLNFVLTGICQRNMICARQTRSNYLYMYNHFVRGGFGQRKIGD